MALPLAMQVLVVPFWACGQQGHSAAAGMCSTACKPGSSRQASMRAAQDQVYATAFSRAAQVYGGAHQENWQLQADTLQQSHDHMPGATQEDSVTT